MTINKAKDLAAQKHGWYDWSVFVDKTMLNYPAINRVTTTAMKIYL